MKNFITGVMILIVSSGLNSNLLADNNPEVAVLIKVAHMSPN